MDVFHQRAPTSRVGLDFLLSSVVSGLDQSRYNARLSLDGFEPVKSTSFVNVSEVHELGKETSCASKGSITAFVVPCVSVNWVLAKWFVSLVVVAKGRVASSVGCCPVLSRASSHECLERDHQDKEGRKPWGSRGCCLDNIGRRTTPRRLASRGG